jgi:hypothetical protein
MKLLITPYYVGPLSPRHGSSSGCGWRRKPPDMEGAASILNKQSRTTDKGWCSILGVGVGLTTPHRKK